MRFHWHQPFLLRHFGVLATAAASFADVVTSLPSSWHEMRVMHTWNAVPANWENLGPPPNGTTIDLHIALKPQYENALIDALYEVSTPRHPKYGAHLSMEEVADLVTPHPDTLELVHSWFEHHGVPSSSISTTHGGGWITLTAVPVSQANEMLGASYQLYRHAGTNGTGSLRTVGYALPTVLHSHVQTVAPTTCFASVRMVPQALRMRSVGEAAASAGAESTELATVLSGRSDSETITPLQVRWLYKTSKYIPTATDKNVLGIVGYIDQYPNPADLGAFMKRYRTDARTANFTVEQVNNGGYDPSQPGVEANLNTQYAQVMAYPTPNIYYSVGGDETVWTVKGEEPAEGDPFLEWIKYMLRKPKLPQTISTSYGGIERHFPLEYTKAICLLFAQLGTRGASVLFPSGNAGVGDDDSECRVDGGFGRIQFVPEFPASCPWVTSVGGTAGQYPEIAANFSGGGFSMDFRRPRYQNNAVPAFVRRIGRQNSGYYNAVGRGIPDIAAHGSGCLIVLKYNRLLVDGTSCATPIVAGIISLLNDYLITNGRAPLGFLNPWLYDDGLPGLNDITSGSNPGCNTDGFSAIAGWDAATGLGTPNFSKLLKILEDNDEL